MYLHPTPYDKDKLAGFLSVVRIKEEGTEGTSGGQSQTRWNHFVSWIPEQMVRGTSDFDAYVLVELSSRESAQSRISVAAVSSSPARLIAPENERDVLVHLAPPMPELAPTATSPTFASRSPSAHAFSHPLASLYSLQVHPPTLTSWVGTVTLSLFGGATLPTLHFHDDESQSTVLDQDRRAHALGVGGGRSRGPLPLAPSWGGEAFLSQIKSQVRLLRSELDPTVYLVNPSAVDLEAHTLGKAYAEDAVPNEALKGVRARIGEGERGIRQRDQAKTSILHQSSPVSSSPSTNDWPDSLDAPSRNGSPSGGMDNLTFSVLSGFSRITRRYVSTPVSAHSTGCTSTHEFQNMSSARNYSQQAASTVLSHPLAKPLAKHVPKPIAQFAFAPGEIASLAESAGVGVSANLLYVLCDAGR